MSFAYHLLRRGASHALVSLLVLSLLAGALPLVAQDATPAPPTAIPTDGPPPEGPATTINGVELSAADFQDRVRLTRYLYAYTIRETLSALVSQGTPPQDALRAVQQFYSNEISRLMVADLLADSVLDVMEEDELMSQLAAAEGLEISEDDIDSRLATYAGQSATVRGASASEAAEAGSELLPAMLAEAEERAGVGEAAMRNFFRGQALRAVWMEQVNGPYPTEWPVLSVRHILVETEDAASDVMARLDGGEDFAAVAEDVSIDTVSAQNGGALTPAVAETYVGPFADAIRDAEVGQLLGPVQSEFGYHIIEVTDRTLQPPDEAARRSLNRVRSADFRAWLDEQLAAANIQREVDWPDMIPNQPDGQTLLLDMLEGM